MAKLSTLRKDRLVALEESSRAGGVRGRRLGGEVFVMQWLVCATFGEASDWERLARGAARGGQVRPGFAIELQRLRALAAGFGLGESWESIGRGDFLALTNPVRSAIDPGRVSPLHAFATRWYWRHLPDAASWWWYLERTSGAGDQRTEAVRGHRGRAAVRALLAAGTTDGGLVHTWRELLGKCERVWLARSQGLIYQGAGFYRASARCVERVNAGLSRAIAPCVELLGRFVDPWGAGVALDELARDFGYPAEDEESAA